MSIWRIGEATIHRVLEFEGPLIAPRILLPDSTEAGIDRHRSWLEPDLLDRATGDLVLAFHSLIIRTPRHTVLVDTCGGNDKHRPQKPRYHQKDHPYLANLDAAGFRPEDIDFVLCTHMHVDHVGWNTMLVDGKWQPTFPNARYLMGRVEFEHWNAVDVDSTKQIMSDSVLPVFDAGLVDLVETDHKICDEVSLIPTVGHSPGHVTVLIQSQGEEGMITGDFIHHPCQFAHPEWSASPDTDPEQARRTRHEVFSRYADTPMLIIGTHFHTPTAGHLKRDGDVYRLEV